MSRVTSTGTSAERGAEPALLTWFASADRARVRSSEWITRANPRVYRVGAVFGRERPIRASTPCDGELGDLSGQTC